jgi:hypothetical protein
LSNTDFLSASFNILHFFYCPSKCILTWI